MNTCETCRYWHYHAMNWGWCQRIIPSRDKPAWIVTEDLYMTVLATDKSFGCTLWEQKD